MKFSKAQIIIKYNIENKSSSIYAHVFEHIFVSLIEHDDWFLKRGAMVFGATNFDYINIEIDLLRTCRKAIYNKIKSKLFNIDNFERYFNIEKKILLHEATLNEESDDERLLLTMLNKSLKIPTLSVQGEYEDILKISYNEFIKFVYSNIIPNQTIISIDGKDFIKCKSCYDTDRLIEISSCRLKKTEDYCTIALIIPDSSFGKDKSMIELLEYLNFSENHGLYKILRNEQGLIYSMEHAYVFIQGLYMTIVEIKCEKEVLETLIEEINKYIQNKLFFNDEFDTIINYLKVLKYNEYLGREKYSHNLYHRLTKNKKTTLKSELKELTQITKDRFKKFLEKQVIYMGVSN